MCLYIITQQTGAALHRALDVEGARERLRSHFMFPSADKPMLTLLTAHSARSLFVFFLLFIQKALSPSSTLFKSQQLMLVLKKIIYVKTKW